MAVLTISTFGPFTQAIFVAATQCNFKIARVNQVRFSVRFVAAISQGFRTCLKLVTTSARQQLHRVAATKIACVNGPLVYVITQSIILLYVVSGVLQHGMFLPPLGSLTGEKLFYLEKDDF